MKFFLKPLPLSDLSVSFYGIAILLNILETEKPDSFPSAIPSIFNQSLSSIKNFLDWKWWLFLVWPQTVFPFLSLLDFNHLEDKDFVLFI